MSGVPSPAACDEEGRRKRVIGKLRAQMSIVCYQVAGDIKAVRAAAIPASLKPHIIHAAEPGRDWAVAPAEWRWPNIYYPDPKELLRHERLP